MKKEILIEVFLCIKQIKNTIINKISKQKKSDQQLFIIFLIFSKNHNIKKVNLILLFVNKIFMKI
jgi:hypothetical protein